MRLAILYMLLSGTAGHGRQLQFDTLAETSVVPAALDMPLAVYELIRAGQPTGAWFYGTADDEQEDSLVSRGYMRQKLFGYLFKRQIYNTVPLYRWGSLSPTDGFSYYYGTEAEDQSGTVQTLAANRPWSREKIVGYVFRRGSQPASCVRAVHRLNNTVTGDWRYTENSTEALTWLTQSNSTWSYRGVGWYNPTKTCSTPPGAAELSGWGNFTCISGYVYNGSTCEPCPAGFFAAATSCEACPLGYWSTSGSSTCSPCALPLMSSKFKWRTAAQGVNGTKYAVDFRCPDGSVASSRETSVQRRYCLSTGGGLWNGSFPVCTQCDSPSAAALPRRCLVVSLCAPITCTTGS